MASAKASLKASPPEMNLQVLDMHLPSLRTYRRLGYPLQCTRSRIGNHHCFCASFDCTNHGIFRSHTSSNPDTVHYSSDELDYTNSGMVVVRAMSIHGILHI